MQVDALQIFAVRAQLSVEARRKTATAYRIIFSLPFSRGLSSSVAAVHRHEDNIPQILQGCLALLLAKENVIEA